MTLILKCDLDMVKMYRRAKSEVPMSRHSVVTTRTDRQAGVQTVQKHYLPEYVYGNDSS